MNPLDVIFLAPISKKSLFLVSLPKKQQVDMVQPFGHFRWSLKHQSPDYKAFNHKNSLHTE